MQLREIVLATDGTCAGKARDFASACLDRVGIGGEDAYDILLALNEAVANSCRHAGEHGSVILTVTCETLRDSFIIQVKDNGSGFRFSDEMYEMPEPLSQGGRGFFLMKELMDDVQVSSDGFGTVVTLNRRVRARDRSRSENGASV